MNDEKWLKKPGASRKEAPTPKKEEAADPSERVSLQKREYFKKLVEDTLKQRGILIVIENILSREEMNKLIEAAYVVMTVALAYSEQADASHLPIDLGSGIFTISAPLVCRHMGTYEFAEVVNLIRGGHFKDERSGEILVLYRINEPREKVDYAIFAVGSDELIDTAVKIIEDSLGQAKAVFKARFDEVSEVYCVLLLPLAKSELENGPIRLSASALGGWKDNEAS